MDTFFGEWLLSHRKQMHLTQAQLAYKAKVSKAYIGHLENARPHTTSGSAPKPDRDIVERLALALAADVNEALLLCGYAPKDFGDAHDLLDGVTIMFDRGAQLNEEDKAKILDTVRLIAAGIRAERDRDESLDNDPPQVSEEEP